MYYKEHTTLSQKKVGKKTKTIYLSPSGRMLNYDKLIEINTYKNIVIICGKYEGIDSRFIEHNKIEELSIGDYVVSGWRNCIIYFN